MVDQESIEKCAEEVGQLVEEEGLNCLINNAGINVEADFHSVTAEKMIENFHTNSVAPLMITKVCCIKNPGGQKNSKDLLSQFLLEHCVGWF